jgi:hypothetical protein
LESLPEIQLSFDWKREMKSAAWDPIEDIWFGKCKEKWPEPLSVSLLRSSGIGFSPRGIDSLESLPRNRFLGSFNVQKYGLR